jgi:hypothetical protein
MVFVGVADLQDASIIERALRGCCGGPPAAGTV